MNKKGLIGMLIMIIILLLVVGSLIFFFFLRGNISANVVFNVGDNNDSIAGVVDSVGDGVVNKIEEKNGFDIEEVDNLNDENISRNESVLLGEN